jgi:hypothetical protein
MGNPMIVTVFNIGIMFPTGVADDRGYGWDGIGERTTRKSDVYSY